MFFVGVFIGAPIFGFISDQFGRKKTLAVCLYSHIPIALAISFMPEYISFTVFRLFLGVWLQVIEIFYMFRTQDQILTSATSKITILRLNNNSLVLQTLWLHHIERIFF